MRRRDIAPFLRERPWSVSALSRELERPKGEVADDLRHLFRSLRREGARVVVTPAECRKCGFLFSPDKLVKPGKCPECRETWIREALVSIEDRA